MDSAPGGFLTRRPGPSPGLAGRLRLADLAGAFHVPLDLTYPISGEIFDDGTNVMPP